MSGEEARRLTERLNERSGWHAYYRSIPACSLGAALHVIIATDPRGKVHQIHSARQYVSMLATPPAQEPGSSSGSTGGRGR